MPDRKDRKRILLTVLAFAAAIGLFLAANFTVGRLTAGVRDDGTVQTTGDDANHAAETGESGKTAVHATAAEVCEGTAPKALKAYVATDSPDRARLLGRYFTPDAAGLDVPAGRIAPQPLEYEYTADGWLCTAVTGPSDGAYVVQDGAPDTGKEAGDAQR
ncbi:hypothetical protein [Bifidobacterium pseudocatenulatum]|uniref:hypothetical protein n=1 Tax=Bifidobacterium pseudocatenulatum TaxID=28026 RepID=UPI0022E276C1|nr:hypothetical protein [Bifidobacterium pseudocatenulatum]